ncbi:alpha/beta hydrolase [Cupriavidus sp. CV2]|uniref:alpha/beta fold hydrolase n=1 Tax=Cupriavidus ulmosensis TaxID=3065913 RepID=UPI00296B0163|nr:alpha/beta hydrolase [Cupriavidus sp. CV2]MDW3682534.1 alpha/beta hydrolase [Cupriavidus sp. CV2]
MDVIRVGRGPVSVVAVHGIQGTRAAWLPLAGSLAADCTFILPNLQGRGQAARPDNAQGYTLARYAAALREVIGVHAGTGPFVLAGWSMGVSVALAYAQACRQDPSAPAPSGLFLLSGSPHLANVQWFSATDDTALRAEIAQRERRLGLAEAADHSAVAWTWQAIRGTDQRALLPLIRTPALVVHGHDDEDSPWPHAVALAQALPHAALTGIAGAGHSVLTHHTAAVGQALRTHLPRLYPSLQESP